jgi:hypothetical protein
MSTAVRPQGVTIIAILAIIGGIAGIFFGFGATILGSVGFGSLLGLLGIGTLGVGIAELITGWGLWGLKPWAWMVAVIVFIINIGVSLAFAFAGNTLISLNTLIGIAIPAVILYYLMTPAVKTAFGRA